jgi:hypothetical protein
MRLQVMRLALAVTALVLIASVFAGCGGTASRLDEPQAVVDDAIKAASGQDATGFLALVAPSFVEQARQQMPGASDAEVGGVMAAGFLEGLPFAALQSAEYETEVNGDKAVVHVYGTFLDASGQEVQIGQGDAVRVPLVNEGGRWYLDLLDI